MISGKKVLALRDEKKWLIQEVELLDLAVFAYTTSVRFGLVNTLHREEMTGIVVNWSCDSCWCMLLMSLKKWLLYASLVWYYLLNDLYDITRIEFGRRLLKKHCLLAKMLWVTIAYELIGWLSWMMHRWWWVTTDLRILILIKRLNGRFFYGVILSSSDGRLFFCDSMDEVSSRIRLKWKNRTFLCLVGLTLLLFALCSFSGAVTVMRRINLITVLVGRSCKPY